MEVPGTEPEKTVHTTLPASTQRPMRPFSSYVNLDLIVYILGRSVFHPAICLIAYLCIAAVHKHKEPVAYYVLYWSAFLCGVEVILYLNRRITFGPPREVDWENEVVVITGGGSGLGRVLMESLVMRGVKVGVLDIKPADTEAEELMDGAGELVWQQCDVGNLAQVQTTIASIVKELGPPTILVNNAAQAINALPLIPSTDSKTPTLSPAQALQTLQTNTASHFNLLHTVLPHLIDSPTGGHIVTLSSVLAHLAPSHLADYAASKAAISALHASLTHEIQAHEDPFVRRNVKTLLVEAGQMDTSLFTPLTRLPAWARFASGVAEGKDVARWITWYVERGEGGVVRLPFYAACVGVWWGVVPGALQRVLRWASGVDAAVRRR